MSPNYKPSRQVGQLRVGVAKIVGILRMPESKMDLPKEPVMFFKATTALVGPDDPLVIPRGGTKVDWEVELAVVIGAKVSQLLPLTHWPPRSSWNARSE